VLGDRSLQWHAVDVCLPLVERFLDVGQYASALVVLNQLHRDGYELSVPGKGVGIATALARVVQAALLDAPSSPALDVLEEAFAALEVLAHNEAMGNPTADSAFALKILHNLAPQRRAFNDMAEATLSTHVALDSKHRCKLRDEGRWEFHLTEAKFGDGFKVATCSDLAFNPLLHGEDLIQHAQAVAASSTSADHLVKFCCR
jgi:hypothetical protein